MGRKSVKTIFTNNKRLCPFLPEPFDDCYCMKMSSREIEKAIYFCSKDFEACEIYKTHNGSKFNSLRSNLIMR